MIHHTVGKFAGSPLFRSSEAKFIPIYALTKTDIHRERESAYRWISARRWCSLWIRFKIRPSASGFRNVIHLRMCHLFISTTLVMGYTWWLGKCPTNSWFSMFVGILCNTTATMSRPHWRDSSLWICFANTYPSWTIAYQEWLKNIRVSPVAIAWTSSASYGALAITPSTFASGWTKNTTPSMSLLLFNTCM